jgi:isopenicillin-N epimerase
LKIRASAPAQATVRPVRDLYLLDPEWTHLNHGSFGACPRPVFEEYQRLQLQLERRPTDFMLRQLPELLAEARGQLAEFVRADAKGLLFAPNVTTALNAVARSLRLGPGDEVLATDHEYGANDLMWSYLAARDGFDYVRRPFESEDDFWAGASERTRVLFVSHITSATAMTFPVARLIGRAAGEGIVSIVDGAHAPGQIDLDVQGLGADFYAGHCHKWLSAPKGVGFLHVAEGRRESFEPRIVTWGWDEETEFVGKHQGEGSREPAAYLSVPAAIRFQREHDWPAVRQRCNKLLQASVDRLGLEPVDPSFVQMVALELPECDPDDLWRRLCEEHRIEAPCWTWNDRPLLRISVAAYNDEDDLRRLENALAQLL